MLDAFHGPLCDLKHKARKDRGREPCPAKFGLKVSVYFNVILCLKGILIVDEMGLDL